MQPDISGSYSRLNYLLRPSKQVERKLLVEALHRLGACGYNIPEYRYVGMGSVYFADFILFHKYLYIRDMLCIEDKSIEKRMSFNKPYDFIALHMGPISEVLPSLDRDRRHLIWLDYDKPLNGEILTEIASALSVTAPGSVVIVTVAAQLSQVERAGSLAETQQRKESLAYQYQEWFGWLFPETITPAMLSRNRVPQLFLSVLSRQFTETVKSRRDVDVEFAQLFNFRYSDGITMVTFGGLLDTATRIGSLRETGYLRSEYVWSDLDPMTISVPFLTIREKQWLDQNLAMAGGDPSATVFEIDEESLKNYCRFYKYYPTYYETLI